MLPLLRHSPWYQAIVVLAAVVLWTVYRSAAGDAFVTPVCYLPGGCMTFSPGAPTSIQKVNVSVVAYSGIPTDACILNFSRSVVEDVISISGTYVRDCPTISLGQLPTFTTLLEPLAAGHYTVNFTASADPTYGPNGWVLGPDGWIQAPILISGQLDVAASPSAVPNYGGLWWKAPAGSESGWGINFAHQGNIIFATWFTYDLSGKGWWLAMAATATGPNTFAGTVYQTTGPAFDATPFDPAQVVETAVGTGTLSFTDANSGTFGYTVNGVSQSKAITREVFGSLPNCTFGIEDDLTRASNYQDLWWASPAGVESGWGINVAHQGDTIVGTWFTYDHDHSPMWLVVAAPKIDRGMYSGTLYRTAGPAFNAVPFDPSAVIETPVGTATFAFSDGSDGVFTYSVNGVAQSKPITREVFRSPGTVCQ